MIRPGKTIFLTMTKISYFQDTKCELLVMSDPYLRLGPFLLEHKNKAGNYIAQVMRREGTLLRIFIV